MTWWHYTLGTNLIHMVADGHIKRATAFVGRRERKAVWFTSHAVWEPSATKGLLHLDRSGVMRNRSLTIAEMVKCGGTLVRVAVPDDVARYTWPEHRQISGIDPRLADALETSSRELGSDPSEWRANYHDVPVAKILRIEASDDGVSWTLVGEPDPADGGVVFMDASFVETVQAALQRTEQTSAA